jgi:hypothetical protein
MYELFSTIQDQYPNRLATAPQYVEVLAPAPPMIGVNNGAGGNIAAVNSYLTINLIAHQAADQPFDVYLVYGANSRLITSSVTAAPGPLTWRIPADLGGPCPPGASPCMIQSRRVSDPATVYASTGLFITQPEIAIPSGHGPYTGGETLFIYLKGHSPGLRYDLKMSGPIGPVYLGRTSFTNAVGDTPGPLAWLIPINWPDGIYNLTSHAAVNPPDLSNETQVAVFANIELETPPVYLPLILK